MQVSECSLIKQLPFTIDIHHQEELDGLNQMGKELANKEGLQYEGYYLSTIEPYSLAQARPTLFFN